MTHLTLYLQGGFDIAVTLDSAGADELLAKWRRVQRSDSVDIAESTVEVAHSSGSTIHIALGAVAMIDDRGERR